MDRPQDKRLVIFRVVAVASAVLMIGAYAVMAQMRAQLSSPATSAHIPHASASSFPAAQPDEIHLAGGIVFKRPEPGKATPMPIPPSDTMVSSTKSGFVSQIPDFMRILLVPETVPTEATLQLPANFFMSGLKARLPAGTPAPMPQKMTVGSDKMTMEVLAPPPETPTNPAPVAIGQQPPADSFSSPLPPLPSSATNPLAK